MHTDTRRPASWIASMTLEAAEEAPVSVDPLRTMRPTHALVSIVRDEASGTPDEVRVLGHATVLCWLSAEVALAVSRYRHETTPVRGQVPRKNLWPLPGSPIPRHISQVPGIEVNEALLELVGPE